MPKHRLSRRRRITVAATAIAAGGVLILAQNDAPAATADPLGLNAASVYLGWGDAPDPVAVMKATGLRQFALSYVLSGGACDPKWDGSRALTGGTDEAKIKQIRAAGGDVLASFGGWDGAKLGERCTTAAELAAAYQKVVDAYGLKAVDIDIESTELSTPEVRKRVVDALKTLKAKNTGLRVFLSFAVDPTGPDKDGADLIALAAKAGLEVDGWTAMPFDFTGHDGTMAAATTTAVTGLQQAVAAAYGWDADKAWRHTGLSSMNGRTDQKGEQLSPADFRTIRDFAATHHLARFGYWAVNRDRPCTGGAYDPATCSGVQQAAYDFTRIVAGYHADSRPGDGGTSCPSPSATSPAPTGTNRSKIPIPTVSTARPADETGGRGTLEPDPVRETGSPSPSASSRVPSPTGTSGRTDCASPTGHPSGSASGTASGTASPTASGTAVPTPGRSSTAPGAPTSGTATASGGAAPDEQPTGGPSPAEVVAPGPAPTGGSLASTGANDATNTLLTVSGALLLLGGTFGLIGTRRRDPEESAAG
ncbi:glycosyl hydrolase family 18 protein [Kitasatospora sp. NPDC088351]|uniref:glycosyl hydrolase family 18 protein n=1 Tax=Kitasatospora sp. NPDC088351 TaxID=3155180 RepID=UPI003437558D